MGTARRHLALLAARKNRLAGEIRSDSLGLRGYRAPPCRKSSACGFSSKAQPGSARFAECSPARAPIFPPWIFFTYRPTADGFATSARFSCATARNEIAATNWHFNAWAKYNDWKKDDAANDKLARKLKWNMWTPCIPRAPRRSRRRQHRRQRPRHDAHHRGMPAEPHSGAQSGRLRAKSWRQIFRDYLGATNILWLKNGITGDDTHGHVDDLARFVNPTTVVTVVEDDPSDANYKPLQENLALLREMKDQDGRALRVETLADAGACLFRRATASGQLREFLHCESSWSWSRHSMMRDDATRSDQACRRCFPNAKSWASRASIWS